MSGRAPTRLRYRVVDVFTDRPLAGNALCVVLDPCPEELMQAVAREMNLSETTFVQSVMADAYRMRIFTPAIELPFAGHPSIGTAWVLGPGRWRQTTAGATVTVVADERGADMSQPDPELVEMDAGGVAEALGLPSVEAVMRASAGGTTHILVATPDPLDTLTPDAGAVSRAASARGGDGLCAIHPLDATTLQVRNFLPGMGIGEDPGTGSAAGPVGLLARRLWGMPADLLIHQGDQVRRPCRIRVHAEAGAIRVGGDVALCAEGELVL